MIKINKIFVLFVLLSFSSVDRTYAQGEVSNGYNPLSLRQVHESYLMWKHCGEGLILRKNRINHFLP